ncbi:hypothetical protein, partial [Prevotellamassilia timonensis]|uniref:hypothetical protein n=1 Tax=Prevotellamassilia timonensis TaxID=1852370 RepID=UPI003FD800CA
PNPLNNSCTIPDARRVAPIRACVSSSTKRYQQALLTSAISKKPPGKAFRAAHQMKEITIDNFLPARLPTSLQVD